MKINTKQDLQFYLDNLETRNNAISYVQCLLDERYDWVDGVWGINPDAPFYRLGVGVEEAVAWGCEDRAIPEPERPSAVETAKAGTRQGINAERDRREKQVLFTDSNGHKYDIDDKARANMGDMAVMIANGFTDSFTWMDGENVLRTHTPASFIQLTQELMAYTSALYATSWAKKAEVDALTTVEEVQAYDVTMGW